ncbi:hypothetical protein [Desertivirga arenae]|uniref:hypothetical protein n=1 Tax=Desertivirga arenae TaxID=2810309 RepID=UPI001A957ACA|nr:hypothetical protein [Pedobacter sp. SYSU D00823]
MKLFSSISFLLFFISTAYSQTTIKVSQILNNESNFAALVSQKGLRKAFLKVSDKNTLVFKPGPVSALKYYREQPDSIGYMSWEPEFARISKSLDWGFSTGPFIYKEVVDGPAKYYGTYVSIWKKNDKGKWRLAVDLGVSHKKPAKKGAMNFANPVDEKFVHQRSKNRLQQREDIVFSSDKLLSTIEKANNKIAMNEFLSENSRLILPDYEPIVGKKAIMDFWAKKDFRENSTPLKVDRAYSGEFAFTQGEATIYTKVGPKKYHYIRIWEVQPGFKWNIILQIYNEAGESVLKETED